MNSVTLKDIAVSQTGPFGSQLHEKDYVQEGTPIVTVEHLGETGFTHQNLPMVSDLDKKRLSKYVLKEGDIVFSRVGSVDRSTYVKKEEDGWLFSGRCIRVRIVNESADARFISYYFRQKAFKEMMKNISVGATMPSLNTSLMDSIKLTIPSIEDQQKIASVLSALDSKIELNNRINAQLEAMTKTLYDYWFVQFDFPDKNGKPYKSSGGKMVWNEELKREIPEGWEALTLDNLANIIGGSTPSRDVESYFTQKGFPWITPKDLSLNVGKKFIRKGELDVTEEGKNAASLNVLPQGSVLMSSRAPVGYLAIARNEVTTNQGFKSFVPKSYYTTEYLFYTIKNLLPVIENNASGSTFKEVSGSVLKTIHGLSPKQKIVEQFTVETKAIFNRQELLEEENQQLASLRDWLLPMLMNGQVTVGGAKVYDMPQQQVSMVAEQQALFDSSPIQHAVDLQLAMVLKALNRKKGDTMMQKDAYNLLALNGGKNPFLKAYNYVMNNFGTYSEQLKKDINNNPYIIKHTDGEKSYYWLNPETENEVKKALKAPENQEFVRLINWLKELYAKPFINNNFDRIELMNTVLKIVAEYQTKDPKKVYEVMKTWKVELGMYKTKAQKFTFKETETMLNLMINKGVVK